MKNGKGLTLIEILIGIAISAMVFIIATSIVIALFGSSTKSGNVQDLEQAKNDLQVDLNNVVKWAEKIEFINGEFRVDDNIYKLQNGVIFKNGVPLTSSKVNILGFEVVRHSTVVDATNPGTGVGLTGKYYDNLDFTDLKAELLDFDIDFDWGLGSAHPDMGKDNFSIRWIGQIETPPGDANYKFFIASNASSRLWIDSDSVTRNWQQNDKGRVIETNGNKLLEGGKRYDIMLEYRDFTGNASMKLAWQRFGNTSSGGFGKTIIPTERLYPTQANSNIEIIMDLEHSINSDLKDQMRLIISPRTTGVIGAIEPAPTPKPSSTPAPNPTDTPPTTPTPPSTPKPSSTPTPPTLPPTPKPPTPPPGR